jgi:stringent starvation protein B
MAEISTKPYLVRAIYEWCTDNGYRPYIAVAVDERTLVPREFVRNGEIVLNIAAAATNRLAIGNELIEFEARFGGVARQVSIPIENVSAIFAQENGHGMAFEVARAVQPAGDGAGAHDRDVAREPVAGADGDAGAENGAGADAASLPVDDEAAGDDTATTGTPALPERAHRRPKLEAVPRSDQAPKPARRKATIAAVPAPAGAPKPAPASSTGAAGKKAAPKASASKATTARGEDKPPASGPDRGATERDKTTTEPSNAPHGAPGDDDPGPGTTPSGRPRLTRVK